MFVTSDWLHLFQRKRDITIKICLSTCSLWLRNCSWTRIINPHSSSDSSWFPPSLITSRRPLPPTPQSLFLYPLLINSVTFCPPSLPPHPPPASIFFTHSPHFIALVTCLQCPDLTKAAPAEQFASIFLTILFLLHFSMFLVLCRIFWCSGCKSLFLTFTTLKCT